VQVRILPGTHQKKCGVEKSVRVRISPPTLVMRKKEVLKSLLIICILRKKIKRGLTPRTKIISLKYMVTQE